MTEKYAIKKAYLGNGNKWWTLCVSLNKKDRTMYNENTYKNRRSNNYLPKYESGH